MFCHVVCGKETIRFLVFKLIVTCAFCFYFSKFSQMLLLILVKKIEILFYSVSFCPPTSGNWGWVAGNFMQVRKAKEVRSKKKNKVQQGAEECYLTVFPVKFSVQL